VFYFPQGHTVIVNPAVLIALMKISVQLSTQFSGHLTDGPWKASLSNYSHYLSILHSEKQHLLCSGEEWDRTFGWQTTLPLSNESLREINVNLGSRTNEFSLITGQQPESFENLFDIWENILIFNRSINDYWLTTKEKGFWLPAFIPVCDPLPELEAQRSDDSHFVLSISLPKPMQWNSGLESLIKFLVSGSRVWDPNNCIQGSDYRLGRRQYYAKLITPEMTTTFRTDDNNASICFRLTRQIQYPNFVEKLLAIMSKFTSTAVWIVDPRGETFSLSRTLRGKATEQLNGFPLIWQPLFGSVDETPKWQTQEYI
jgi:hypothetical protein